MMHLCLSVRGALRQTNAELRRMAPSIIVDGKPLRTAEQVREFMFDQLAQGHEVLPFGDCDNFDYKKGCLGHETQKGAADVSTSEAPKAN